MKKTLSLFLSFLMIISSFSVLPISAFADGHPITQNVSIKDKEGKNHYLSPSQPCYKNGADSATSDTEGANVIYDQSTGVMILDNFDGGTVRFNDYGDVTIQLKGTNNIKGNQFGIYHCDGNLTINSEKDAVLNITNDTNNSGGIVNQWSYKNDYSLTISGNTTVNLTENAEGVEEYTGIRATNLNVLDNSSISVNAIATKDYSHIYGFYCNNALSLNTAGKIDIELGTVRYYCTAFYASEINFTKVESISLKSRYEGSADCFACPESAYNTLKEAKGYEISENLNGNEENGYAVSFDLKAHKMTEYPAKAASCVAGNNAYYYCSGCKKYFKDKEGTKETTPEAEILPANSNHSYDAGKVTKTTASTYTKLFTCKVCKYAYTKTFNKSSNTITVKAKKPTVKYKSVKKKNQTVALKKWAAVSKAQGSVSFKKSSGNKKITVAKNGKITIKKGLKKGTYKVKIKVTAAGNAAYKAASKTVSVSIKVK